jgi:flagellar basal-body rod modification protein FlgD
MSDISGVNSALDALSVSNKYTKEEKKTQELGQDAFLQLMISQLKNQDPLSPQDNGEFVAQLAQFSSVEGIDKLNNNFDAFANKFVSNQALQASSLVGRSVTVETDTTALAPGGLIAASSDIPPGASNFSLAIQKSNGAVVQTFDVPSLEGERFELVWNGKNAQLNGKTLPVSDALPVADPGVYTFKLTALVQGKQQQLSTDLTANVNSVTLGKNGSLTLNLAGAGPVSLSDVKEINE